MLNAFSRDIRSVRAQENIGVHLEAPLLVEHFPEKSDPYLSSNRRRPSTADLEAHAWINERPHLAQMRSAGRIERCPSLRARRKTNGWVTGPVSLGRMGLSVNFGVLPAKHGSR
jgi:hypothetical protein